MLILLGLDAHQATEILSSQNPEEYWELLVEIQCSLKVKLNQSTHAILKTQKLW